MTKPIILTEDQWAKIYSLIAKTYPPSVLFIRNKMKAVLGFTPRTHQEWVEVDLDIYHVSRHHCVTQIHLDFYNEPKRTMFLLRYSDIIGKTTLDN
jgi:hypothetical protein